MHRRLMAGALASHRSLGPLGPNCRSRARFPGTAGELLPRYGALILLQARSPGIEPGYSRCMGERQYVRAGITEAAWERRGLPSMLSPAEGMTSAGRRGGRLEACVMAKGQEYLVDMPGS